MSKQKKDLLLKGVFAIVLVLFSFILLIGYVSIFDLKLRDRETKKELAAMKAYIIQNKDQVEKLVDRTRPRDMCPKEHLIVDGDGNYRCTGLIIPVPEQRRVGF